MSHLAATEMTLGELSWKSKAKRSLLPAHRAAWVPQSPKKWHWQAPELLLLARNENELKKVAAAIASLGGKSRIYPVDLSNPDQVTAIAQRIEREATVPDIIVNNAGSGGQWKFLDETTPKEIQDMMAVPYFAAAWLTRAFLPAMRARNSGHIVNISSV